MKKRITALLLCLVMVFSLIPTTVWAANGTGHKISVNIYKVVLDSTKPLGYQNPELVKTITVTCTDSTGHSGYNHSVNLKDFYPDETKDWTGWQFASYYTKGNDKETFYNFTRDKVNATANVTGSEPYPCSKNFYLVYKDSNPEVTYTLTYYENAPAGTVTNMPSPKTVTLMSITSPVTFTVSGNKPVRDGYNFLGWAGNPNATEPAVQPGNTITTPATTTNLYAVWEKENTPDPGPGPGPTPDNPGPGDKTPDMTDLVTVKCVTANANHDAKTYGVMETGLLSQDGDNYKYTVTLSREDYINKYSKELAVKHTDATSETNITLTWTWKDNQWVADFEVNPVIECECKTEIEPPTDGPSEDDVKAALGNLWVKCINGPKTGSNCTPCEWPAKLGYSGPDSLTKVSDTEYTVELGVDVFVNAYTKRAGEEHGLMSAKTLTWVLTFDKESGKWVGAPKEAGVDDVIQVAHRVPVHVVIYRNGDTSKAYADIALNSELPGTVIDLTKLKIGNYYTANYTGKYDFYGWYDDGLMNVYKANVEAGKDAPAGMKTIKVNGWTNIKCMVYDHEKVVYFKSAEDLAAYQKDHSKNDGLLYTTTVRRGTTLPTADAPAATRTGYTFKFWSREGQNEDVTGQTVGGWTNLYANWEINTYNIAATLYMNGADSSVQETGKTYPWSHRYGGEYGKSIDYTDMFATLKAKALEVDAANKPYDAEIKLCFPKSDKLFNETIKTYGQDGAFWNPGVKNTAYIWGHATTSYEVIFNTGDGSEVATQIVKYGELATEPTTELKGYDFLGWFDADGNEFDFDNTKITHKTTLTAKWEKKTYIIASDLRINGGDANLADGKTYPWSYRYGGKFEETIDYREMFDALKTRAMKVDEANSPVDSVVTLCFPGDDPATAKELFNDTILTYGQDGGGWNPGNKNTAPIWGFATNVYAVTFNYKDDKTATATQNVEYGNMATEPQKVDRPGYRFLGWFTDEECTEKFEFTTPITKSMTLYAGWEIIPHDIYAYANVYSAYAPLTTNDLDTPIELNETTLSRLGLGSYNDNGFFSISKFNFNGMPLTEDLYMAYYDDDEFYAVVDALKDKDNVANLDVEKKVANKVDWQSLYKTVNENDMPVGYPTEDKDSYQLSGNLELATVMFRADADDVKGMPAVNYTYDDVLEIHDFYFAGDTFTMPADPTREAYDFLGWRAVVIPSENDAECLADNKTGVDGDANTNTGDEKLYKAGDTYTITDGGVIFVAQWKIKTYTVKFVSFDSVVATQEVEHGKTATRIKNPEVNDYVFKGWYLNGQLYDFNTPVTSDITLVAQWVTKTSNSSGGGTTTKKDDGKTVQSGKTFDGGIALYVGLSVLSVTGSAWVITKKKRG